MQLTTITDTFELNNGLKMPKVGFGTWQTKPGKETYDAVSNALKAGYRFIDTATAYANEQSVGEASQIVTWPAKTSSFRLSCLANQKLTIKPWPISIVA